MRIIIERIDGDFVIAVHDIVQDLLKCGVSEGDKRRQLNRRWTETTLLPCPGLEFLEIIADALLKRRLQLERVVTPPPASALDTNWRLPAFIGDSDDDDDDDLGFTDAVLTDAALLASATSAASATSVADEERDDASGVSVSSDMSGAPACVRFEFPDVYRGRFERMFASVGAASEAWLTMLGTDRKTKLSTVSIKGTLPAVGIAKQMLETVSWCMARVFCFFFGGEGVHVNVMLFCMFSFFFKLYRLFWKQWAIFLWFCPRRRAPLPRTFTFLSTIQTCTFYNGGVFGFVLLSYGCICICICCICICMQPHWSTAFPLCESRCGQGG